MAVSSAVDRFVSVGQSLAEENVDIKADMCLACHDARMAGRFVLWKIFEINFGALWQAIDL